MEVNIRPSLRDKYVTNPNPRKYVAPRSVTDSGRLDKERRDESILREMWLMVAFGLSIFLGGFGIWGLDRLYCSNVRRWRHEVGLPWGILSEGHGWW
jgi:dihydroceramidase